MNCHKCQSPNDPGMQYCTNCGAEIGTLNRPAAVQPSPNWSAAAAPARIKEKVAAESSANPADDPVDEVTHVLGPQGYAATVRDGSGVRAAAAQIGRTIDGKYRLEAVIGEGGMGSVYRATRLLIGDSVAIKLLHHEHVSAAEGSERFRREAQAAAKLKHPNAVSIYDFGVKDGLVYLVMELVDGQSLRSVIKDQGPLSAAVASDIINQVCAALDEAHRQGIVHRDLKPDNIIVEVKISGMMQVKVLDFGIAKLRDVAASDLTQTGSIMGTPRYMSPEQCLGEELDQRSDIYSLGIVAYEMVVGAVPFNAPTSNAVVLQQVNKQPPRLREFSCNISPAVEAAVLHALAKRREDRPQTAGAFAAEFSAAVHQERPTDTPGGAVLNPTFVLPRPSTEPVRPAPRDNTGYLVPIMLGTLLLAAGVIAGLLIDFRRKVNEGASTNVARAGATPDNRTGDQSPTSSVPDRNSSSAAANIPSPIPKVTPPRANPSLDYSLRRNYQGTIAAQPLMLNLQKTGNHVEGRAETPGSWDYLEGPISPDGYFELRGHERGGDVTGIYKGQLLPNGTVHGGTYHSNKTGKNYSFKVS